MYKQFSVIQYNSFHLESTGQVLDYQTVPMQT